MDAISKLARAAQHAAIAADSRVDDDERTAAGVECAELIAEFAKEYREAGRTYRLGDRRLGDFFPEESDDPDQDAPHFFTIANAAILAKEAQQAEQAERTGTE